MTQPVIITCQKCNGKFPLPHACGLDRPVSADVGQIEPETPKPNPVMVRKMEMTIEEMRVAVEKHDRRMLALAEAEAEIGCMVSAHRGEGSLAFSMRMADGIITEAEVAEMFLRQVKIA